MVFHLHMKFLKKLKFNKFFNKNLKFITQAGGRMGSENLSECLKLCIKNKVNFFFNVWSN